MLNVRRIKKIKAREILDSRGNPTIEVKVYKEYYPVIETYTLAAGTITKKSPTSEGIISFIVPSSVLVA